MTPTVKSKIYNIIKSRLPKSFSKSFFWANERRIEPDKPYVMLVKLIPEQDIKRAGEYEKDNNLIEVSIPKNTVITVIVNARTRFDDAKDGLDTLNDLAESTARNLKNSFKTIDSSFDLQAEGLSFDVTSKLRDLTTSIEGGYNYRYEFDLTIGYDEVLQIQKSVGQNVILDIKEKNSNA